MLEVEQNKPQVLCALNREEKLVRLLFSVCDYKKVPQDDHQQILLVYVNRKDVFLNLSCFMLIIK